MSIDEKFLKIEKKFAWSFLGFVLALVFGIITIYTSFLVDKNPKVDFIIESNTKVLALNADIKRLDILYNGENIKQENKNLSIITLKVINNSSVNILNSYYDDKNPLGFIVTNAEIVENPEVISSSNDYLKDNLILHNDTLSKVVFSTVIIESNDYFVIKLLLLSRNNQRINIKPIGKIAGVKEIKIIDNCEKNTQPTFWKSLLEGSIWIHLARFLGYTVISIILVILTVIPGVIISESISEKKKKNKVSKYKLFKKIENNPITDLIFENYINYSIDYLEDLQKILSSERNLKGAYFAADRLRKRKKDSEIEDVSEVLYSTDTQENRIIKARKMLVPLLDLDLLQYEKGVIKVNSELVKELNDFISYIKLK